MDYINFKSIYAFTYQETLPHKLFYLFLKSSKAVSVSLIGAKSVTLSAFLISQKFLWKINLRPI